MWYMPYMRVRTAVKTYAYFIVGLSLVAVALRYWPGAVHSHMHDVGGVNIELSMIIAGSAALVGGLATVLGLNLAAENDGHLELAWTKPISREGYALGVFAVDIAAMAACVVLTVVCAAIVVDVDLGRQVITLGKPADFLRTLAYCGFPLCVYAWITVLSASLRRNRGAVAGLFWPLMTALVLVALIRIPAVHAVATAVNLFNPLVLYATNNSGPPSSAGNYLWGWAVSALCLAIALMQWRRLQL